MDLTNLSDIKALLARHGFHFSKSMGQNFLIEDWVPRDIAHSAQLDESCGVLEIGPGIGPLTVQLAQQAGKVVSVELDRSLLPILKETVGGYDNVEIVPGDVMKLNIPQLMEEKFQGLTPMACANLPYNITTPVITLLLESGCFRRVTVMIQREVAKRICAQPGTSDFGAFSVFCQYHAVCEYLFEVPAQCFLPAPKVTSAVIGMTLRDTPPVDCPPKQLFSVIRAAFAQRRKTLLNALSSAYGSQLSKEQLRDVLTECGFAETVRGEQLGLEEFSRLAHTLYAHM